METASRYPSHCRDLEHQAVSNVAGTQAFPACGDALAAVVPGDFVVAAGRLYGDTLPAWISARARAGLR